MTTTNKLVCLSTLLLILACGKEELADNTPLETNSLGGFTTKPLSVDAELVEKEVAFEGRAFHTSLVYNKKMWVMAGQKLGPDPNDVWQSENGKEWKLVNPNAAFSPRSDHAATVHDEKMWIVGGRYGNLSNFETFNDVWFSKDGENWEPATKEAAFSKRSRHTLTTFKGRMWVIGGAGSLIGDQDYKADVWVSGDGENWVPFLQNAPFGKRADHTALVYDDKLWVIGGYVKGKLGEGFRNDVWYTEDGINWILATPNAKFPPRSSHTTVSYDGYMWVIAGYTGNAKFLNDIWRSSDGVTWDKVSVDSDFKTRAEHTSVVFDNRFWAITGYPLISYPTKTGVYTEGRYSDVWSFGK